MGIETERFVDSLPQEALCPICCLVLRDPVCTPCKHYVCQDCWNSWKKGTSSEFCPYCCTKISSSDLIYKSTTIWKLVLNFNVYCLYKKQGCTSIYKLSFEDSHMKCCPYNRNNNIQLDDHDEENENCKIYRNNSNCNVCYNTIDDSKNHDCIESFHETVKCLTIKTTNLEYENDRLSLRLTTKENGIMDQIADLESRNHQEALNYEREIRELRTQIATLQGELNRRRGETEERDYHIALKRQNGSLGFNIVGGYQEGKDGSGIFISRIAENGAASKPGKLQLNDQVLEVNGKNLRNASHDEAVQAFKNSHGPVEMIIRRQVKIDQRKWNAYTQTEDNCAIITNGDVSYQNEVNRNVCAIETVASKSCDLTDSAVLSGSEADESVVAVSENGKHGPSKSDLYDSAYDTLLTQKSSRSNRIYILDDAKAQMNGTLDENEGISSEGSDDIRTLTPSTVVDACGSPSSTLLKSTPILRNSTPRKDSLSTDDSLSPIHGVKLRQNSNNDNNSPRKVIRRSTYFLVEESLPDCLEQNGFGVAANRKDSLGHESTTTTTSNEIDVEYEYEYEELSLRKDDGRFGIQLSCGGEEDDLSIYIKKIESGSAAERSRALMVGDQLIQINHTHVRSVEEACKMLQENESLTMLVARPVIEIQKDIPNGIVAVDDKDLNTLPEAEEEIEIASDSTQQDSEFNTALELAEDSAVNEKRPGTYGTSSSSGSTSPYKDSGNSEKQLEYKNITSNEKNLKDDVKSTLKDYVLSRLRGNDKLKSKETDNSMNNTGIMENTNNNTLERKQRIDTTNCTPKSARKEYGRDSLLRNGKRDKSGNNTTGSDTNTSPNHQTNSKPARSAMKRETTKKRSPKHVRVDTKPDWTLTEKRVWEEFKIIQNMEADGEKELAPDVPNVEAEWKVRRSKDGKHIYIRKQSSKQNKSRIMKERAERLAVERTGITTDDDTNTIYLGRFWNKEERKRQLLRHRLKREKLLERQVAKDSILPNPMDAAMAEIVQKKMTAPGHVFDDFLTVEEILTQRNRDGFLEGPIHVTTV